MKATELQLGDYVNYRGQIIKVTSLYDKGGSNEVGWGIKEDTWVNAINVEPISLTPEILEKNGFVPKFLDGCLIEYLIYKDIVDGLHEMYIKIVYFNTEEKEHKLECFDCRTGGCQIWIKYVHQLQHALRLCGIEIEIEL